MRARGFTLIELLIALSLAGLLVAGAFQIHAVFNSQARRQSQLTDIQQSLRVSMQIIERAIRGSGAGMLNGKVVLSPGCSGARTFYRVQYYDTNAWPPPLAAGTFHAVAGVDTDPDILRVLTATDVTGNAATLDSGLAANVTGPVANWAPGDFLLLINTSAATALTANGCFRQITAVGGSTPTGTLITHDTTSPLCANDDVTCPAGVAYPTPVRRFGSQSQAFFRIMQPPSSAPLESPKLVLGLSPIGAPNPAQTWSVISDDIEDMQIALVLADGRVCNSIDDPALCDPAQATAVRITLVARTAYSVPGKAATSVAQVGGYEDMPGSTATDGKLRRALTSEIILRN